MRENKKGRKGTKGGVKKKNWSKIVAGCRKKEKRDNKCLGKYK